MKNYIATPRLVLKPMAEEDCSQAVAILRHNKVKATYMLPDLTEEAAGKLFRRLMEMFFVLFHVLQKAMMIL